MSARVTRKVLALVAGAVVSLIAVVGASTYLFVGSLCENESLTEAASPDGKFKAIVFQRDCGATTGFSTQVSVVESSAAVGQSAGNVFTSDTNHGAAPSGLGGGPVVKVHWHSPDTLVVSHHTAARVFTAESQVGSVKVHYEQLSQ
jgi:hypothetical protein